MAIDVTADVEIARPVREVASFAMEAENDTRWIGGITEARRLTPGATVVGTRVARVAHFMGRRIEYVMEVAELEADRKIVLRSIKSPFPMTVTYSFDGVAGGTRASVRVQGDPGGGYKLAGGLMSSAVRRNIARDVRRLKEVVEDAFPPSA